MKTSCDLSVKRVPELENEDCSEISAVGNIQILKLPRLALFCSQICPGMAILNAYKKADELCGSDWAIVSGFHSLIERDCLDIFLKKHQPVIYCPARGLGRIPGKLRPAVGSGDALILTPFNAETKRMNKKLSIERNQFVANISHKIIFLHITKDGLLEKLAKKNNDKCLSNEVLWCPKAEMLDE